MDYFKLILGLALIITFYWLLMKNSKRTGLVNTLLRFDTILGVIAGLYLTVSAIQSLLIH